MATTVLTAAKKEPADSSCSLAPQRGSASSSPVAEPSATGYDSDVEVVREVTQEERTHEAKRAATDLSGGAADTQGNVGSAAAPAFITARKARDGGEYVPQETGGKLALAVITSAERNAESGLWKLQCLLQVPSEMSDRRCLWQSRSPRNPDHEVADWGKCREYSIDKAGKPFAQTFSGVADGEHKFFVKVRSHETQHRADIGTMMTQAVTLRPDLDQCEVWPGRAVVLIGTEPRAAALAPKRHRGDPTAEWRWEKGFLSSIYAGPIEVANTVTFTTIGSSSTDVAAQTVLANQLAQRQQTADHHQATRQAAKDKWDANTQARLAAEREEKESKRAWQLLDAQAKEAQRLLEESRDAAAWVSEHQRKQAAAVAAAEQARIAREAAQLEAEEAQLEAEEVAQARAAVERAKAAAERARMQAEAEAEEEQARVATERLDAKKKELAARKISLSQ